MEVGQGKDDGPELRLLCTAFQNLLIELSIGTAQIGLEAIGRLVGELNGVLKQ